MIEGRVRGADSTDRRNIRLELLCRCEVVQCLSWSFIEFPGDGIKVDLEGPGMRGSSP